MLSKKRTEPRFEDENGLVFVVVSVKALAHMGTRSVLTGT